MGYRRQPFGYQMKSGQIIINPPEAEIVQYLFKEYEQGASYNDLVIFLCGQNIPYNSEKGWNKNVIARILEDKRYLGEKGCPPLIEERTFQHVAQLRIQKKPPIQKTEAQKILCHLCRKPVTQQIEQTVLNILNDLIRNPKQIVQPTGGISDRIEVRKLEIEFDKIIATHPIDEDAAKQYALLIAEAQYKTLGANEYETRRLQHIFSGLEPMEELDADILQTALSEVCVLDEGILTIRLKNGQSLARR